MFRPYLGNIRNSFRLTWCFRYLDILLAKILLFNFLLLEFSLYLVGVQLFTYAGV